MSVSRRGFLHAASGSVLGLLLAPRAARTAQERARAGGLALRPDARDGFFSIMDGAEPLVRSSLISARTEDDTLLSSDPRYTQVVGRRGEETVLYLTDRRGVLDLTLAGRQVPDGLVLALEATNRQRGILRLTDLFPIAATRPTRGGLLFGRSPADLTLLTDSWERSYGESGMVRPAERSHVDSAWDLHVYDRAGGRLLSVSYYDIPNARIGITFQAPDPRGTPELVVKADTRAGSRGVILRPGATFRLAEILIRLVRGPVHEALLGYAEAIRDRNRIGPVATIPTGWLDWYYMKGTSTGAELSANLAALQREFRDAGLAIVQLDSGWQIGVETEPPPHNVVAGGPWEPNSRFAEGMRRYADRIRSAGFRPGIWIRPFQMTQAAAERTRFAPWFNDQGQMDMTRPDVRDAVRRTVRRIVEDWGYDYIKVDFAAFDLYGAFGQALADGMAAHPEPYDQAVTNVQAFRDALGVIHEAAGSRADILACNTLMPPTLGLASSFRIGDDVGGWERIVRYGVPAVSARYYMNGVYWANDPDVLELGPELTIEECRAWASLVALSGGAVFLSNRVPGLPEERLEIVRRLLPVYRRPGKGYGFARPVDLLERFPATIWNLEVTRSFGRWNVIGLFNWSEEDDERELTLADLGLEGRTPYLLYDFWKGELLGRSTGLVPVELPYRSCLVLAAHPESGRPAVLSTTRHISQGGVELEDVRWDGTVLSGRSAVIGGRPCGIVVHVPENYRLQDLGGSASLTERDGEIARLTVEAPASGTVEWMVRFATS